MTRITAIKNARLRGRPGLHDIQLDAKGKIASVTPISDTGLVSQVGSGSKKTSTGDNDTIDAAGNLVLPSFIDVHLHLDLAYSLDLVPENKSGTLIEAIGLYSEAKKSFTSESVTKRAIRAIHAEVGYGSGAIRNHVDVGEGAGLRLTEGVLAAREETRDICDIQIVAFPQDGVIRDKGAYGRMKDAIKLGVDLVGGIAHYERTPRDSQTQIEMLFRLAKEFDRDIDCHIDETDSPDSRCVEYLAAETIRHGWQGRVTASHVCALANYEPVHASKVIRLLKEADIHVVTNPQVNLHLQGRFDAYPKRRGLTRVSELMAAGVNVSSGQDCIVDPFYPLGTGQMLDVAHTLVHADHLSLPHQMDACIDTITVNPAKAMRRTDYGLAHGCRADLVILPVETVHEALRIRPRPTAVLKAGLQVALAPNGR